MHTVPSSSTHPLIAEAELREIAADRAEANAAAYIANGLDPFTHAANLRAVALMYRRKHAALIGGGS